MYDKVFDYPNLIITLIVNLLNSIGFNEKFNVSSAQTIDLTNKLGNSIFGTTKEVTKLSDTLFTFSRTTGQSFSKIFKF